MLPKPKSLLYNNSIAQRIFIVLGNFIEHYDAALYGLCIPLIADQFFPQQNHLSQLIYGYGIFSIALISRPLGAYYFSRWAHHHGLEKILSITLIGIGGATLLLSLAPPYHFAGLLSVIYLMMCRLLQGFFAGGETSLAPLALIEINQTKSSFNFSWYGFSTITGIMAASFSVQLITHYPAIHNLWRSIFFSGGVIAILLGLLRHRYYPPLKFKITPSEKNQPIGLTFQTIILTGTAYFFYSFPFIFLPNLISLISPIVYEKISLWNTGLLLFDAGIGIIIGWFADRLDRRYFLRSCLILYIVNLPLIIYLVSTQSFVNYIAAMIISIICGVAFNDQVMPYLRIQAKISFTRLSILNAISSEALGKTTPVICLFLWQQTHQVWTTFIYGTALCVFSYLSLSMNLTHEIKKG